MKLPLTLAITLMVILPTSAQSDMTRRVLLFYCGGGSATPSQCQADVERYRERLREGGEAGMRGGNYDGVLVLYADRGPDFVPVGAYSRKDIQRARRRISEFMREHDGATVDVAASSMGFVPFRETYPDYEKLGISKLGTVLCIACSSGASNVLKGHLGGKPETETFSFDRLQPDRAAQIKPIDEKSDRAYGPVDLQAFGKNDGIDFGTEPWLSDAGRRYNRIADTLVTVDRRLVTAKFPLHGREKKLFGGYTADRIHEGASKRHTALVERVLSELTALITAGQPSKHLEGGDSIHSLRHRLRNMVRDEILLLDAVCGSSGDGSDECGLIANFPTVDAGSRGPDGGIDGGGGPPGGSLGPGGSDGILRSSDELGGVEVAPGPTTAGRGGGDLRERVLQRAREQRAEANE